MEPSPDGQLEIIANSGAKSVIWEDRIAEFGYEKYFLRLPEPALNKVLRYLRYPDLQTLKSICPELTDLCDLHVKLMDHSEFYTHPKFQFERCSPDDEEEEVVAGRIRSPRTSSSSGQLDKVADEFVVKDVEIMSERQNACATYFEPTRSLYLFGGEAIDGDEHTPGAVFNDLWRLDTATLKWSRVIISSAPYPSAMCYASLVTWGTQLILFGGNDNRRRCPFANVPPELHYFDTSTSTWRYVPATGNSPSSIGHSAVVSGDYMFVYGGWPFIHNELHLETPLRVERLQILDIRHETWKTVQLEKWNPADPAPFPRFHTRKTKLILIRDGLLLITGELIPQDYGSSVLLQYDVTNPLNDTWRWKSIPTIGRWWGRKFLQMEVRGEAVFRLNPECSMPNIEFHQIADVRNEKMIRLVSLGRLRSECAPLVRATFAEEYDAVQSGYRDFARQLKCHLEMEYKRRIDTSSNDTCAIFKYLNLVCKIGGCFVRGKTPSTPTTSSHANSQRFHIHVRSIPRRGQNDEPKMPRFDDVDLWELRCTIRAVLNQLHSKYYNTSRMDYLAPRVPMRNSALKRLSVYVAEVPCHVEFEEFDELRWTPQAEQYPSPVDTDGYFLVGSHHDVIMHSGRVRYPGTLEKMGQTILLTPIAEK